MTQPQRPDQRQLGTSRAGVGPAPGGNIFIGRLVIIYGTGTTGWFEYSGMPGAGNEPIAYAVPPGITKDPYGNALPASGGVVSQDAGVAFSQLISGGLIVGLTGAIMSAQDAVLGISGSSSGQAITLTSGAGPEAGAEGTTLVISDSGAGGIVQVTSGADGSTYDTMRLTLETTVSLDVDSTSPVTLFTFPVAAGTYAYQLEIPMLGTGTGIPQLRFSSAAAVVSEMQGETFLDGGTAGGYVAYQTALNTFGPVGPPLVNADANRLTGSGIFTFSTAGTILVEMDASTSVPTCTIPVGARMHLYPVTGLAGSGGGGAGATSKLVFAFPSGDVTGAIDYARLNAILAAGQTPVLTPGTWYTNTTIGPLTTGQWVLCAPQVFISWLGTGDCFRWVDTSTYTARTTQGGGILGRPIIDGTGAGAASTGLHAGDILGFRFDIAVQNFTGAGDTGILLDNQNYWTEQCRGVAYLSNCTQDVTFNCGGADTSAGSFDRGDFTFYVQHQLFTANSVTWQNGAYQVGGMFRLYGNYSSSNTPFTEAVMSITGQAPAGHPAGYSLLQCGIDINIESDEALLYTFQTVNFGSVNNTINGYGTLNYGAGNQFAISNVSGGLANFIFFGPIIGDTSLEQITIATRAQFNTEVFTFEQWFFAKQMLLGELTGAPGTPVAGGYLYVDATGHLTYVGPGGTITILAGP
jgi:hypothetical protein